MAIYAIGDIQGCYSELVKLLELISFDPAKDKLWLVGDLVNRGPDSLSVLRLIKSLDQAAVTVLGNHDLHLLAVAEGCAKLHRYDSLHDILAAPDRTELLAWLRRQRILYTQNNFVLVHAGLLPSWSISQAQRLAYEVETELKGAHYQDFLAHMYGNHPNYWNENLNGYDRLRVITNALTRMRICTPNGRMEFKFKGKIHDIPDGYLPWFEVPERSSTNTTVVCGHWSALGLRITANFIALDTGCLWGGSLTAIRLDDRQLFQIPCSSRLISPPQQEWRASNNPD